MKIAPIPPPMAAAQADPQVSRVQTVRSMRMNTNATPGRLELPPEAPALTNPDPNEQAEGTAEATQPLSPQAAALAKQRRALQVKERELNDREKAIADSSSTQDGFIDPARLKSEPLRVLLEAGVTYDQLTEAILANQNSNLPEIEALKAKIQALEEGVDKKLTDRDAQTEQQVLAEMQREAVKLTAEGDDFQLVRETKSIPQVMQLIERTYRDTGEVLDVSDALQLVEDELLSENLKIAGLSKVQSRIAPPAPPPQQRPPMRTLSNRDMAAAPMTAKQRALAAFHGQQIKR